MYRVLRPLLLLLLGAKKPRRLIVFAQQLDVFLALALPYPQLMGRRLEVTHDYVHTVGRFGVGVEGRSEDENFLEECVD